MFPMQKLSRFWVWHSYEAQNGTSTLLPSAHKQLCKYNFSEVKLHLLKRQLVKDFVAIIWKYSISKAVVVTNTSIKNLALHSPVSNTDARFSSESLDIHFCLTGQKNPIFSKKHTILTLSILLRAFFRNMMQNYILYSGWKSSTKLNLRLIVISFIIYDFLSTE